MLQNLCSLENQNLINVKCPKQPLNDVLRLFRKYLGKHLWWNPILDYIFANLKKTDEIIVNLRYTQNTAIGIFHNLRVFIKAKDDFFVIFGNSLKSLIEVTKIWDYHGSL